MSLCIQNIPYYGEGESDAYKLERCVLDIYYPENIDNYATLLWIHGGGLNSGENHLLLKAVGTDAELYEMPGFDHGTVLGPAAYKIREDIKKLLRK